MLAGTLIKDIIPPLKITDSGERALAWMSEFRVRYLPVVSGREYLGIVSENDLLGLGDKSKPVGEFSLPLDRVFISDSQHVFDAIRFVTRFNYPVVPVLDNENLYAGLITVMDLIQCFSELNAVETPGGIIRLEVDSKNFLLSEIAQIVESHDASIVSLSAVQTPDGSKTNITLKVNRIDLTRILAALYRHNYDVKAYYHQSEFPEDLQNRYDAFMNYLKM